MKCPDHHQPATSALGAEPQLMTCLGWMRVLANNNPHRIIQSSRFIAALLESLLSSSPAAGTRSSSASRPATAPGSSPCRRGQPCRAGTWADFGFFLGPFRASSVSWLCGPGPICTAWLPPQVLYAVQTYARSIYCPPARRGAKHSARRPTPRASKQAQRES